MTPKAPSPISPTRDTAVMIGVVTVTYNSATVIDGFMRSMLGQRHAKFLLYVIDNASTDGTRDAITRYSDDRINLVPNHDNVGVAAGNNQGIQLSLAAGCDYVLLINNDTEFDEELIGRMLEGLQRLKADMLVPKVMYFEPKDMIWCAGGYFKRGMGYVTGHSGDRSFDRGQFDAPRKVEYSPTCCMLIRAQVFHRIGVMDERYFVYGDDTDFCWRAHLSGVTLWYDPTAILFHKVSSLTGGYESDFTIRYATRNKVYFALKHLGPIPRIYSLTLYHVIFLAKLVLRKDTLRVYKMKLRAFAEGRSLFALREA